MNIIQQQAKDWIRFSLDEHGKYEDFISKVRSKLYDYRKDSHKLEFVDQIILIVKLKYDNHLKVCEFPNDRSKCNVNKLFENVLFFLQNERDEILEVLPELDFTLQERTDINVSLQNIINDLNKIKFGQEITYDDLTDQLNELKEFYFLNKKHWTQLLIGRLSEMVASGIISEAICKDIVETISKNYAGLIN